MVVSIYTSDVIDRITKAYVESPDLETARTLAAEIGVSERSIIAKLSALGIYKKKVYTTKTGGTPVKKESYIEEIAELLEIDICLLESLEKVTKQALILMVNKIKGMKDGSKVS